MSAEKDAAAQADLSAAIRDYLTNETDCSRPSFHATALTHRIASSTGVSPDDAWSHFNHHTPESFWDVAVWRDGGWVTGSLDVADRKRIGVAVMAAVLSERSSR